MSLNLHLKLLYPLLLTLFTAGYFAGHRFDLNPLSPGNYQNCELVQKKGQIYLSAQKGRICFFDWKLYYPSQDIPKQVDLKISGQGSLKIQTRHESHLIPLPAVLKLTNTKNPLTLKFEIPDSTYLEAFQESPHSLPFEKVQGQFLPREWNPKTQTLSSSAVIGVNLEAEYLLNDLKEEDWRQLFDQIKKDGFHSVRLHKFFRVFLKNPDSLRPKLQGILKEISHFGLSLYMDGISFPETPNQALGWVWEIFLQEDLKARLWDWLHFLSELKLGDPPFFTSRNLKWFGVLNENSLFAPAPSTNANLEFLRLWLKRREEKSAVLSLSGFKAQLMLEFGLEAYSHLKAYGYEERVFLNNSMLGGEDAQVSRFLSYGETDRHFYLDYPAFHSGFKRIRNLNPVERYQILKSLFLSMGSSKGIWLSEVNLPWPNQYQHQLLPLLLALHQTTPIKGLWFYDYRLRSRDFHKGGIFGVQRFSSIINPLPLFSELLNQGMSIKEHEGYIKLESPNARVLFGMTPKARKLGLLSITEWHTRNQSLCFSFEKAQGDRFDVQGNLQFHSGKTPVHIPCD